MENRRMFLKKAAAISGFSVVPFLGQAAEQFLDGQHSPGLLKILPDPDSHTFCPLEEIEISVQENGLVRLYDSKGAQYAEFPAGASVKTRLGGAAGTQWVVLLSAKGRLLDMVSLRMAASTYIRDSGGTFAHLLKNLYTSMIDEWERESSVTPVDGKFYHNFVRWLRDHVHTMKGMKYFYPELKSGIDMYADYQRADGMIWDNIYGRPATGSYWEQRFSYGDFYLCVDEGRREFKRIPVENDVEFLFLEGIYFTWKATGDTEWMKSVLDKAVKAVNYSFSDPYRWSEKYQLLKRGFTIDTWDFQNDEDAAISVGEGELPDPMVIKLGKTRFGVMYGDNTGMYAGLLYLAEMLRVAGREREAVQMEEKALGLLERLNALCWNGAFYTHHVAEDTSIKRDLGVDTDAQVSLSNAYSINRGIGAEKSRAIIGTYQRLRSEMPASSPGEWYTIYPPFEKGYGGHNGKWEYMNGGVTSIVAGELAHGAFENGYETYGVDILRRVLALSEQTEGHLHCAYRGSAPVAPERSFNTLSIRAISNADFVGNTLKGVAGWTGEGENDLHEFPSGLQTFHDIPFDIVDPAANGRKACLGLSTESPYLLKSSLKVGHKAASVYLLHATGNSYSVGSVTLTYADGTSYSEYIGAGKILGWWYPEAPDEGKQMPRLKVAWRGKNNRCLNVGVSLYGFNNPQPEKLISTIEFEASRTPNRWMVLGVTLSSAPVFFMPDMISTGIPDNWGAAAVMYALVEGLAGVKDKGAAFDRIQLSPRWESANEKKSDVCIAYPASGQYVAYVYQVVDNQRIELLFTSPAHQTLVEVLLPSGSWQKAVLNGKEVPLKIENRFGSAYATLSVEGPGVMNLIIS